MSDNLARLPRELHRRRTSAGIRVSLWWSPVYGRTWVAVRAAGFVLPVRAGDAPQDWLHGDWRDTPAALIALRDRRTRGNVVLTVTEA